jgi:hypothetical protein
MYNEVQKSFNRLSDYCIREEFKGYDPYDGLNSRFFQSLPVINKSQFARLAWIQAFKRLPVNLRPFFGVHKDYNPKALGLFLSGYCALYQLEPKPEYLEKINFFTKKISDLISPGYSGACWGYNFEWQARAFFQPKYTPTIVASSFIANALLDAYDLLHDKKLLDTARSTCDFILKDLNRTYDKKGNFSFSYSAEDKSVVYNASLLGSKLLARVSSLTGESELMNESEKSVIFCCEAQKEDGSWSYGTLPFHQWIDNFHTGYNLECISDYMKFSGDYSFRNVLDKGFRFYIDTFFTEEGIPKYYSKSVYPIDIHASAQLVITLVALDKFHEKRDVADRVLKWTMENMQSGKGYYYYKISKFFTSKIPYMRWSQAWMFYALSKYLLSAKQ